MRVLFLFPRTLDASRSMGGVAEFLCSLTPELKSLSVDSVIYAGDKTVTQLTKPTDVLADAIVYNGPFIKPGWWIRSSKLAPVLDVCRSEKIDVIHAQGTYTAGFMALKIHQHTGIPYVVTSHSDILTTNSKRMNRRNVRERCKKVLKYAAAVTHLTPMMEAVSHELYDTSSKSTVIGNGIDCKSFLPFAGRAERNYMLGIGRLERGKGFHILIDMFASLVAKGAKTSLVIAGKGSEEQALFAQVKQLGLDLVTELSDLENIPEKSVIFAGYVRDDFKKRLIAESKIVLFATQPQLWEEAFGIVQLEAMAAGKTILASDTNVTRFLHESGMQCRIVGADNVDAWAEQAEFLLTHDEIRQQMGRQNLQAVTAYDWRPIAVRYQSAYEMATNPESATKSA
jgi:glycosyltransferase involved in cell wall biosynthesis